MHDLDRTNNEFESEFEGDYEYEFEDDNEFEADDDREFEFESHEMEGSPFSEEEEMELAAELLSVGSDQELEQFLGSLLKKAGRAVGKFAKSSVGRSLGKILKGVVKKALPVVGGAIGSFVAPGAGTAIGSSLGSLVGRSLELEYEGMDHDEMEFETAKRLVRIAGSAAQKAATRPTSSDPSQVARDAIQAAVKKHVRRIASATRPGQRRGTWVRRGHRIILMGV